MKILRFSFLILLTLLYSCVNEPLSKPDPASVITVDSELFHLLQRAAGNDFENEITCIDFNYAFTLIIFDENLDLFGYQIIRNDNEFSQFLGSLEQGKSISLSYPISGYLDNGDTFTINNNAELKEAIDLCSETDILATCNGFLTASSCIWKIKHLNGPSTEYDGSYFEVSTFGNAGLYFQNSSFGGTWVTYFIENKLHLNIFITGDEAVSTDWNFDWKVITFDESQMEIENGIDHFLLTKDCYEPCRKFLFEECETEPGSGKAVFDLESYFDCFFPLTHVEDPSTVSWTYYETYEDMEAGTNPIIDLMYENTINPQVIYIRFDDINTGGFVISIPIILKAINCSI